MGPTSKGKEERGEGRKGEEEEGKGGNVRFFPELTWQPSDRSDPVFRQTSR